MSGNNPNNTNEFTSFDYQLMIKDKTIQDLETRLASSDKKLADSLIFLHNLGLKEVSFF